MRHALPSLLLLVFAATMVAATIAANPFFKAISPSNPKVVKAAKAAVSLHNMQNDDILVFLQVLTAERLDRGAAHYTYRMLVKVNNAGQVERHQTEILEFLGAPGQSPVYNFGSFVKVFPTNADITNNHPKVIAAAKAAVSLRNNQNNDILVLIKVLHAERQDRGAAHYTYKLLIFVDNGGEVEKYWTEILEDLGTPGQTPVYNFGTFVQV